MRVDCSTENSANLLGRFKQNFRFLKDFTIKREEEEFDFFSGERGRRLTTLLVYTSD